LSALSFESVAVHYGERVAVAGFTDTIQPGEWLCLIGPNGAGKSSLLRAVAGLVPATGVVNVAGMPLSIRDVKRRAALVAYVPQIPELPEEMTAFDYVLLGRNPYIGYFARESRHDVAVARAVLERLALTDFAARRLGDLSGGERQRLVVARALAQEAPILLLDEATSALDIGHQQQALELVDRLRREQGITVVSAMHDLTLAGLYADRLALMHQGHVVASGPPAHVLRAETLSEFYGASVTVHTDEQGTVVVIPRRSRP
jgi:iron complex transport system ATP-binding protein